jgi:signal transduction histidine kinase
LLQIAEAESGMRIDLFASQGLNRIAQDMAESYAALAEEKQVTLKTVGHGVVYASCDRDLLASALANPNRRRHSPCEGRGLG